MNHLTSKLNGRVVVLLFCITFTLIMTSRFQNETVSRPRYSRHSKVASTTGFPCTRKSPLVAVQKHSTTAQNLDFSNNFKLPVISEVCWKKSKVSFPVYNHSLPNFFLTLDKNISSYKHSILAFAHTPKSGGTTVKRCMKAVSALSGKTSPLVLNGSSCFLTRLALLTGKLREEMIDSFVGSSLGICDYINKRKCGYFTIIRDPYDRIVSHYFFCKEGKQTFLSCENKTIVEFARRVGSTFFTQLSARFRCLRQKETRQNQTWICDKRDFAYNPQSYERDVMLAYLVENLESLFAVIGLTEEFDFSLKLLQEAFGWPFFDKCKGDQFNVGSYLMNNSKSDIDQSENLDKHEAKKILISNKEIGDALYPDVALYLQAKEIFQKEKEAFLQTHSSS